MGRAHWWLSQGLDEVGAIVAKASFVGGAWEANARGCEEGGVCGSDWRVEVEREERKLAGSGVGVSIHN